MNEKRNQPTNQPTNQPINQSLFSHVSRRVWVLLFLCSCQTIDLTQVTAQKPTAPKASTPFAIKQTVESEPPTTPSPELLQFENQVQTQSLQAVKTLPLGKHSALRFSIQPIKNTQNPKHIQIPETGPFQLHVQVGARFAILDADARDGLATVQLPQDTYHAYLKLGGRRSKDRVRSLKVQDDLYALKDDVIRTAQKSGSFVIQSAHKDPKPPKLSITALCSDAPNEYRVWKITNPHDTDVEFNWELAKTDQEDTGIAPPGDSYLETDTDGKGDTLKLFVDGKLQDAQVSRPTVCLPGQAEDRDESKWWSLGSRTVPVPASWQAPQGDKQVFQLNNQGVSHFAIRWVRTPNQAVSLPPGINEIGPAGGKVELPGVAKLEIPAGALSTTQTIRLRQRLQARQMVNYAIDGTAEIQDFITPIVNIEPADLNLQSPAQLTLPTGMSRVGQNHAVVTSLVSPLDESTWGVVPVDSPEPYLHTSPLPITQLGTYAKVMPQWIKSTDQYVPYEPKTGFQTQSVGDCSFDNSPFLFLYNSTAPGEIDPKQQLNAMQCFGNKVWNYYTNLLQQAGASHFPNATLVVYLIPSVDRAKTDWVWVIGDGLRGRSKVKLPTGWDRAGIASEQELETFAHELWHVFQYAALPSLIQNSSIAITSQWSIEGSAQHMDASAVCQFANYCAPPNFTESLEKNQGVEKWVDSLMPISVHARPDPYTSVGFFNYLVNTGEGDLLLAKLATKTGGSDPLYDLDTLLGGQLTEKYKDYGYSAFTLQDYTFKDANRIKPPPIKPINILNESHTKESPKIISGQTESLGTNYAKVALENPEQKTYKVLVRQTETLNGDQIKNIVMVVDKNNQVISKTDVEPGSNYVEIPNFDGKNPDQFLVLASSNGQWRVNTGGIYSFNLALELNEPEAVSIKITPDNKLYTYGNNNGGKFRTVEVTVRDDEGKPVPKGTPIYVKAITKGRLTSHQMIDAESNTIWGNHEAKFETDEDGKFKFDYKLQGLVDAHEYSKEPPTSYAGGNDPWPNLDAPNTLFQICSYKYRSSKPGWGGDCDKILFPSSGTPPVPEDPLKGRIFWMGPAYAFMDPEVEYGFMNGNRYTFTVNNVRDKSGELVPDGTAVYVTYPYWLSTRSGQVLFPSEGDGYYPRYLQTVVAQLITHGGMAYFEAQTRDDLPYCWGGVEDVFTLLGTHTSHSYPFYPRDVLAYATLKYQKPSGCR